jgi:predicted NAD/FAD-binding protein
LAVTGDVDFLRRIGTEALAPLQPSLRVRMVGEDAQSFDLVCPPIHPPWHLVAGVLRWPALAFRDRWTALSLRGFLADVRRVGAAAAAAKVPPDQTVSAWLSSQRQSPQLCEWLWHPLAIAALNQSPHVAAAAPFARVLGELFGPRVEDSSIGIPSVPLDELYAEPARRFLEAHGGAFSRTHRVVSP